MKTKQLAIPKTVFLFLLITMVLCKCSNLEDDTSAISEENDYYFTVKIDGKDFSSDTTPSVSVLADETGFYNIQGNADNGDKLALTLISPTSTGTIEILNDENSVAPNITYSVVEPFGVWAAGSNGGGMGLGVGTITIIKNTASYMEGTFSFTGLNPLDNNNTKEFTEGRFKAKKF